MLLEAIRKKKLVHRLLAETEGQATVEYILILSVTVFGASQFARLMLQMLDKGILRVGSQVEQDLKTGRAPLSVWKN